MAAVVRQLTATASLSLCLFAAGLPVQAAIASESAIEQRNATIAQATGTDSFYQRARQELSEDIYVIYRVVERLARANNMADKPWRVGIVPKYDINAFAADVNLIAVFNGILDQLHGDPDALACVLAHEMGHHVKRHIAVGSAERAKIYERLRAEAEKEALAEAEDARRDSTGAGIGGAIARTIGGIFGGAGRAAGNVAGSALENESRQRVARAQQRIQEIAETKKAAIDQEWRELDHKQEFEADEQGYLFMVRAGFDAQGCLRAMDVLSRIQGSETDSATHPSVPNRITALKKLAAQNSTSALVAEGKANLTKRNQPLTYSPSKDQQSLRINSYRGRDDIDRQLPR